MAGIYGDYESRLSPTANDKIGNITDQYGDNNTLLGFNNTFYKHIHNPALCYPTLDVGVTVASDAATAWKLGAKTVIIPADDGGTPAIPTIPHPFDIHWINFESASATGIYELHLYANIGTAGADVEIARIRTTRDTAQSGTANVPVQIPPLPEGSEVSAKLASSAANRNVTVSVMYHTYE